MNDEKQLNSDAYLLPDERADGTSVIRGSELAGTGAARQLVSEILTDARHRGLAVLPYCSYVAGFIRKNSEQYLDLVPTER